MAEGNGAESAQNTAQEPKELLKSGAQKLAQALAERALSSLAERLEGMSGRLTDFAAGDGSGLLTAITGSKNPGLGKIIGKSLVAGTGEAVKQTVQGIGKKGSKSGKQRVTNIVEWIDVGAPIRVVYNTWTQFEDFPGYMKKVESVNQDSDEKISWKAQVFLSHRAWESHIIEQLPDQRIIWRSSGGKGYVDGAVTFHAITPDLTRILLLLEYHPQGMFEHTGNIWRAQGRRARLELKHFRRHVMTRVMLHPDEAEQEGWRGEIHDGEVVKSHEEALEEERAEEEEWQEERPTPERAEELPEEEEEEEEFDEEEEEEEPAAQYDEEEERQEKERARHRAEARRSRGDGRPVRRRPADDEAEPRRPVRRGAGIRRG